MKIFRQKYIEEQMAIRTQGSLQDGKDAAAKKIQLDDAMLAVPEHLRQSHSKKSEDMLSNQMLSGIPEVDLGVEYVSMFYCLKKFFYLFFYLTSDVH